MPRLLPRLPRELRDEARLWVLEGATEIGEGLDSLDPFLFGEAVFVLGGGFGFIGRGGRGGDIGCSLGGA